MFGYELNNYETPENYNKSKQIFTKKHPLKKQKET